MKTLYRYQAECVNEIDWHGGNALVACEPGLGKTLMALEHLRRHPELLPAVVVCPASVKFVWHREARDALGTDAAVLEGMKPPTRRSAWLRPALTVVNYDILRGWREWLRWLKPKCVVLDECQYLASAQAKRTKACVELCKGVRSVLALSGTPLVNRPIELFNTLHILRPDVFTSRWHYGQEYCAPRWTPWGWEYKGASKPQELHRLLLDTCMVRRRKADVLRDLPQKLRAVVPVPLKSGDEYAEASLNFIDWLAKQDPGAARRAARAEAVTRVGYLLRLAAKLKMDAVVDWITNRLSATDEKLVVFAVHTEILDELRKRVPARSVLVDGSVTGQRRTDAVDLFQNDNRVRVFLGNIQAAGVGITLTAASTVVFTELSWRPGDHIQAEDRCHRIGATETVWAYYLVAAGTIEEQLCGVLQDKQAVLSGVLDGGTVNGDLNVFDELMKQVGFGLGGSNGKAE